MVKIDSLDEHIIALLQKDALQRYDAIARQLEVSPPTIKRRIDKLIKSGVIHITAVVDPDKIGFSLTALIALDVEHAKIDNAIEELSDRSEFTFLASTTGRFDIIGIARFNNTEDLYSFLGKDLAKIDGIKDTESFVCLHVARTVLKPHKLKH